jgi:urease accessory protein
MTSPDTRTAAILLAWFSPAFPVGAFAFSHGLETVAAEGLIAGEAGLSGWIRAILGSGGAWTDAVLLAAAYRAAAAQDWAAFEGVAALGRALAPSLERLRETLAQGEAFALAVGQGWPRALARRPSPPVTAYPVVAGGALASVGAPLDLGLVAYLNGFVGNLVAVGIRLGLCGQSGGVRILAGLGEVLALTARRAANSDLDDLGACAFGADIASMRHETLEPRIFVS